MTREQAYASAVALQRRWDVWIVRQPSGNYYLTDRARNADGVAVAVVRRGTQAVTPVLPRAWKSQATR